MLSEVMSINNYTYSCWASLASNPSGEYKINLPANLLQFQKGSYSKVTEDADVSKLLVVAVRIQAKKKSPFQCQEAPNTGQIKTLGV